MEGEWVEGSWFKRGVVVVVAGTREWGGLGGGLTFLYCLSLASGEEGADVSAAFSAGSLAVSTRGKKENHRETSG